MTQCIEPGHEIAAKEEDKQSGVDLGESMIDVAISVCFAVTLAVFLGWYLWQVCKPEVDLRARAMPSNHISAQVSRTANIVPKEEGKAEEPAKAA
jgi:hypothetical protein